MLAWPLYMEGVGVLKLGAVTAPTPSFFSSQMYTSNINVLHTLTSICVRSEAEGNTKHKVLPRAPFPLRHRASEGCRAEGAMDTVSPFHSLVIL